MRSSNDTDHEQLLTEDRKVLMACVLKNLVKVYLLQGCTAPLKSFFFSFLYLELLNLHLVQDQNRELGKMYCVWYVLEVQCLGFSGI